MIVIKSEREIELMRKSGLMLAQVHEFIRKHIVPGISTYELDQMVEKETIKLGGVPAFKGYHGFPGSMCMSVNEQVVHGIPSKKTILKEGDIISCDGGVLYEGYYSDACRTWSVGVISPEAQALIDVTRESFEAGLKMCQIGNRISDIGHAVQVYAESRGYGVVRDFVGHGIGTALHEAPEIPNYGSPGKGPRLREGMVIAVEPMINIGSYETMVLDDGWTAVTVDGSLSAHYENTIAITKDGPVILTQL